MSHNRPGGQLWARDFTPGFLDSPERDTLPLGATPEAKNGFLYAIDLANPRATMGRRPGSALVTPTAMTPLACVDGLFEWRRSATDPQLLAVCYGELREVSVETGVTTLIGSGWTPDFVTRMTPFRNDAFIYDGSFQRRWDGTTLFEVGSGPPTGLTNMAAGVGTLTGTYEAVYTWYNSNRDHHSSPSAPTSTLALVGQGRSHTKPASAAPTWATHWGVWVRRTDTFELNFFFVKINLIAAAADLETVSDTARQRGALAPLPSSHDAPPGPWSVLTEYKGFGIGILTHSDSYYASAQGDLESWHPAHKFPVSRAVGDDLCWCRSYGTTLLIGTSHATWKLLGDAVPLRLDPVHARYGNVSQEACLEVEGKFYGWDRIKGPYVTDLSTWRPLGLNRIDGLLATVNRTVLDGIKAIYVEAFGLIGWIVPTDNLTIRRRTLLWYHVALDAWLPPQTGLEYGSITEFTDAGGTLGVFLGDFWGRIYRLFTGSKEGVPTTTPDDNVREAAVISATASTVTLDVGALALYTTGSGLAGLPVAVLSPAGTWQWRRIESNTADTIIIDTTNDAPWETIPDATYVAVIGGIEWFWWTPWIDFGLPHLNKKLDHLYVQAGSTGAHPLTVRLRFNNDEGVVESLTYTFDVGRQAGIWDVSLWDVALWGQIQRQMKKKQIPRTPLTVQVQFSNYRPDQEMRIALYGLTADPLPGMQVPST